MLQLVLKNESSPISLKAVMLDTNLSGSISSFDKQHGSSFAIYEMINKVWNMLVVID